MTVTAPGKSNVFGAVLGAALGEERGEPAAAAVIADRHVDEQHPAPAQPAGQDSAEEYARGAAGAGDGAPDPERAVAFGPFGEGRR